MLKEYHDIAEMAIVVIIDCCWLCLQLLLYQVSWPITAIVWLDWFVLQLLLLAYQTTQGKQVLAFCTRSKD